jgi:hypothetical protein
LSAVLEELINLEDYEDWQKQVIYEKKDYRDQDSKEAVARQQSAAAEQARLADALGNGPGAAADYLFVVLSVVSQRQALQQVPELPNALTEGEMSQLPEHAERELALSLHESISSAQAAQPAVWALCHAVWIKRWNFGRNLATVFCEGPRANTMEARTRNFLRRTGGLRRVRGNTSPLVDCPIAAAWWRCRIAQEASGIAQGEGTSLSLETAHKALRVRDVWENLVTMSLKRVTSVCAPRARAAAVVAFSQVGLDSGQTMTRAQVQGAIRELARFSHGYSLWYGPWSELLDAAVRGMENADGNEALDDDQESIDQADT